MNPAVAQKIRSAQVVLDPAAIIKELLENALDAGATRIDIRVRGKAALDSITVSDNGTGISSMDYHSLCLPATTSKLSHFADLDAISTFGFRGEALSAICSISKSVSFSTKTSKDTVATTIKYAPDGSLLEKSSAARPLGTTASVDAIFNNLPVRRKDALKNATREVSRCIAVVQALALISIHTRIELKIASEVKVLSQSFAADGLRPSSSYVSSPLCLRALRITAKNVLGTKTASALVEVAASNVAYSSSQPHNENEPICDATPSENYLTSPLEGLAYRCSGLTSSASLDANGAGGRAKSSHQYIFANRRPVDFPRLTRAVNELYRRSTGLNGAAPVLILNLDLPQGTHDVNISPDKRSLLIREEDELVSGIVKHLEGMWAPKKAAPIPVQRIIFSSQRVDPDIDNLDSLRATERGSTNRSTDPAMRTEADAPSPVSETHIEEKVEVAAVTPSVNSRETVLMNLPNCNTRMGLQREYKQCVDDDNPDISSGSGTVVDIRTSPSVSKKADIKSALEGERIVKSLCPGKRNIASFVAQRAVVNGPSKRQRSGFNFSRLQRRQQTSSGTHDMESLPQEQGHSTESPNASPIGACFDAPSTILECPQAATRIRNSVTVKTNWDLICGFGGNANVESEDQTNPFGSNRITLSTGVGFRNASFAEAEESQEPTLKHLREAELEMSRLFQQEWFKELQVLGQFNKGFIICCLGRELFIIDQHASDEKYNFEDLQKNTIISRQKLVQPLRLEFSAQDEVLVLEHIDSFLAGGFGIEYRAENKPTQRLFLQSQPVSKHTMFVQDDLQEIVAGLKAAVIHSSSLKVGVLRPPRIRAMFASRACRKSIMIGTALKKGQMQKVVRNLATIEHPWTCPHGRPTMRHLCTLPET